MTYRQEPRDESYPDPRKVEREFARLHAERVKPKPLMLWAKAQFVIALIAAAALVINGLIALFNHFFPFGV